MDGARRCPSNLLILSIVSVRERLGGGVLSVDRIEPRRPRSRFDDDRDFRRFRDPDPEALGALGDQREEMLATWRQMNIAGGSAGARPQGFAPWGDS